ncbi:MAG: flagellar hook assembly protein FlgD [Gammaproteobacteria bacterium]|nr:flagellar hook assembly protein FlgD [Gammaproteobacteria bacterium]
MTVINNQVLSDLGIGKPQSTAANNKSQLGQQDFLKLMTTQLNNQDPMKPMASGEFYSQIAQFSSVAGIQDLQKSFTQVASAMLSSQALQASSLVGRDVLVPGSQGPLSNGGTLQGAVDVPQAASGIQIKVHDAAGSLVRTIDLGDQNAGLAKFQWDGKDASGQPAAAGVYTISAQGLLDGAQTALGTLVADRVDSVTINQSGQGVSLNLNGHGAMDLAQVQQIM